MITASDAYNASMIVLTGLTYIDELISGATDQGLFTIVVNGQLLTSDSVDTLKVNGYVVNTVYPEGNRNFPKYIIDWS